MSVGCIRNTNDLQNKKQEYAEYLQLMIDNEEIKEKRIKDYKNPNKPPPVPPQYKTASEQTKDLMTQEKLAFDNMKELGIDIAEVRSFVIQLEQKQDGIDNLVKLNRNFPAFKKIISEKYLAKTLDAPLLLNAWEEFSANINAITGLKSISSNSTSVYSNASDNYKKLPLQEDISNFRKFINEDLFTETDLSFSDSVKSSLESALIESENLLLNSSTINKIDDIPTPLEKRDINNLAENLLTTFKIPTKTDLETKFENIEKNLSLLTDVNSVTINDAITKDLVILTRFLSSFFNETARKKLTEYNKFINDKIFNLESSVAKETTVQNIPNIDEGEIPESYYDNLQKSKVQAIKTFMQLGLYKEPKYKNELNKAMRDENYNPNDVKDIINFLNVQSGAVVTNIVRDYFETNRVNKANATKALKQTENDILDDLIEQLLNQGISEEIENISKKEKEEEKRFQLIYNRLHERYESLNPSIEEIVLLIDEIVEKFIINQPDNEELLNHLDEVIKYAGKIKSRDYLLDEAISLFAVDDSAPDFIMNYAKTIEGMRKKRITKEQALATQAEDVEPISSLSQASVDKYSNMSKKELEEEHRKMFGTLGSGGNTQDLITALTTGVKFVKKGKKGESNIVMPDVDKDQKRRIELNKLTTSQKSKLYSDLGGTDYKKKSNDDIIQYIINQEKINEQLGPAFAEGTKIKLIDDITKVGNAKDTLAYVWEKIQLMTPEDFYDRFKQLWNLGLASGKREVKNFLGQLTKVELEYKDAKNKYNFIPKNTFLNTYGADKKLLIDLLFLIEFGLGPNDNIDERFEKLVSQPKYYNPELRPLIPKQGFGMKKKKGGDLVHIDIGSHIGKNYKESSGKGFSNKNWVGKAKKEYQSGGDQPYIKSRIKIGSGISKTESPTYQEFGKFIIHTPQLEKNILNFKYPSLGRVPNLPRMNIDDDTKDLIFNILETGKMSENQFNKIPQSQQDYLIKAIKGAGLESILFKGKCKVYPKDEKEDRERFNILKGEFDAGNDNPALIKELRALVIKFSNCGIIPKKQGLEFLTILNDI